VVSVGKPNQIEPEMELLEP